MSGTQDLYDRSREIRDPIARAAQESAIRAWSDSAPKRFPALSPCPGCGVHGHEGKGRLCLACMTAIVQSGVNASREGELSETTEAISLERAEHWNKFPMVSCDTVMSPGDALFLPERDSEPDRDAKAYYVFRRSCHRLLALAIRGLPGVPPGVPVNPVFGGNTFGSDKITGLAPKGFKEAVQHFVFLSAWMIEKARAEGFEKGQNLLSCLAAGTMTMDDMNERVIREMDASERRSEDMERRKLRS